MQRNTPDSYPYGSSPDGNLFDDDDEGPRRRNWHTHPVTQEEMHAWARLASIEWNGSGEPQNALYRAVMEQWEEWGNQPAQKDANGHYIRSEELYDEIDYRCLCWFSHMDRQDAQESENPS